MPSRPSRPGWAAADRYPAPRGPRAHDRRAQPGRGRRYRRIRQTTTLAAVRAGFETAGYTVLGTATSGQAAKTLGEGAGMEVTDHRLARRGGSTTGPSPLPTGMCDLRRERHDGRCRPGPAAGGGGAGRGQDDHRRRRPSTRRRRPRRRAHRPLRPPPRPRVDTHRQPPPNRTRANGPPWPSCATGTSPPPSTGTPGRPGRTQSRSAPGPASAPWSKRGPPIPPPGNETLMLAYRRDNVEALNQTARRLYDAAGLLGGPELTRPGRAALPGRRPDHHPRPRTARRLGHLPGRPGHRRGPAHPAVDRRHPGRPAATDGTRRHQRRAPRPWLRHHRPSKPRFHRGRRPRPRRRRRTRTRLCGHEPSPHRQPRLCHRRRPTTAAERLAWTWDQQRRQEWITDRNPARRQPNSSSPS